jgi:hypothetical protein
MYGVVLLAALAAAEESAGWDHKKCYPAPVYDGGGYPGYHNHGGWGKPYGGYAWPGYGCPDYWGPRPVVTVPPEPLVVPPNVKQRDPDEEDDEDADRSNDNRNAPPKRKNGEKDRKNGKDEDADGAAKLSKLGVGLVNLTAARRRYLGYRSDDSGVIVSVVDPKSVGETGGLRIGMLVQRVNGVVVVNAKEAADLINKGNLNDGIRLQVLDPLGETRTVTLKQ